MLPNQYIARRILREEKGTNLEGKGLELASEVVPDLDEAIHAAGDEDLSIWREPRHLWMALGPKLRKYITFEVHHHGKIRHRTGMSLSRRLGYDSSSVRSGAFPRKRS